MLIQINPIVNPDQSNPRPSKQFFFQMRSNILRFDLYRRNRHPFS